VARYFPRVLACKGVILRLLVDINQYYTKLSQSSTAAESPSAFSDSGRPRKRARVEASEGEDDDGDDSDDSDVSGDDGSEGDQDDDDDDDDEFEDVEEEGDDSDDDNDESDASSMMASESGTPAALES